MSDLFGALSMGQQSLQTQLSGLKLAGQNMANVNNPNYSRQRLEIASTNSSGVEVASIQQIRDTYLDKLMLSEKSISGYLDSRLKNLEYMEASIGNAMVSLTEDTGGLSSGSSIFSDINGLFNSLNSLSNDPSSGTNRILFINQAEQLTSNFNRLDNNITNLENNSISEIELLIKKSNEIINQISDISTSITKLETKDSSSALILRDRRLELLEQLGKIIPVDVESENGKNNFNINLNGESLLVDNKIKTRLVSKTNPDGKIQIFSSESGNKILIETGSIGAVSEYKNVTLPTVRAQINSITKELSSKFNAEHAAGYSLLGSNGENLFLGTTSKDLQVNPQILKDQKLLQISNRLGDAGNNEIILSMLELQNEELGNLDGRSIVEVQADIVAEMGQSLSNARSEYEDQKLLENQLLQQRQSTSGVSLDEEIMQLVKFQRAFEASARFVSTIDNMIGTVINLGGK